MPDRDTHDRPQEHAPLGEGEYLGPDRRKHPGIGTTIHTAVAASSAAAAAAHAASEPEWWRRLPNAWKMFIQLGFMGLFVGVFLFMFYYFFSTISRSEQIQAEQQASFLVALQGMQNTFRSEVNEVRTRADSRNDKLVAEYHALVSENRNLAGELRRLADALYLTNQEMRGALRELPKGPEEQGRLTAPAPRTKAYSQPTTATGPPAASGTWQVPVTTSGGGLGTGDSKTRTTAGSPSGE